MRWGILLGALLLAYPLIVYLGLSHFEPRMVALVIIALAAARLALVPAKRRAGMRLQLLGALVAAFALGILAFMSNSADFLRFYPVCLNALMLVLFLASLLRPPSMIERFARITEPHLPESGVHYTRQVTKVWCAFFLLNGSAALYSAVAGSLELWTLYNGVIAYILMGLLFAGEYGFRIWWRQRNRGR